MILFGISTVLSLAGKDQEDDPFDMKAGEDK
jgi:hypothetical protein